MSLPAGAPEQAGSPARAEMQPEPLGFTLAVVSPSSGVASPLTFPRLPASTTVSQLKAKIRDALPSKPSDDSQRLIHRGRLLGRDAESMQDIFGEQTLQSLEPQTLHLVLRPTGPDPPLVHPSTPLVPPQRVTTPIPPSVRPQSTPANPLHGGMHAQQPLPGFQHLHHHHAVHQAVHQAEHMQNVMAQRLQTLQRETARLQQEMGNIEHRSRTLASEHPEIFNNQNDRPAQPQVPLAGIQGRVFPPRPVFRPPRLEHIMQEVEREQAAIDAQHSPTGLSTDANPIHRQTSSGRASPNTLRPDHTATYSREGVGPNGERWHMTVNESTSTFQLPHPRDSHLAQGTNPSLHAPQALARNTDGLLANRHQALQNLQNIIRGTANAPPPAFGNLPPTPMLIPTSATNAIVHPLTNPLNSPSGGAGPIVYILSSPQGPQALLVNNSATYYSVPQPMRYRGDQWPAPAITGQAQPQGAAPMGLPEHLDRADGRMAQPVPRHHQENPQLEPVGAVHANPGGGALGAQIWPMIWLIIRLAGFIWFFTAGNNSWSRFFMITALAVVVFFVNTGIFNGIAETLWGPVRRHIEVLIPLAGPEAALVPAANAAIPQRQAAAPAGNEPRVRRRRGELDEREVAARLLEQRRQADQGWLVAQVRRAEHAALLFLASLVPGVGERHIAAREAEANAAEAERQRQIEADAAAEIAEAENSEGVQGQPEAGSPESEGNLPQETEGAEDHAAVQPLVEV